MLYKTLSLSLLLFALTGCGNKGGEIIDVTGGGNISVVTSAETGEVSLDKLPVTRAMAAKMLSLAFEDKNYIETMDREILFSDTSPDYWYDKYINFVYVHGLMSGTKENVFLPEDYLTLAQAQLLIDRIDKNNKIKIKLTNEIKDKPISYALFTELYLRVLKNSSNSDIGDSYNILEDSIVVMTNAESNKKLKKWVAITDKGPLSYEGFSIKQYNDTRLKILKKDDEIVAFLEQEETEPTILNAYIINSTKEEITVFTGGVSKTYRYINELEDASGKIADIKISGDNALEVDIHSGKLSGTIKMIDEDKLELLNDGLTESIPLDNAKIYSVTDGVLRWRELYHVIPGTSVSEIFLDNDRVSAIVIKGKPDPEKIRVCINTSGYSSLIHESVVLTSETDYSVKIGSNTKQYKAGEIFTVSKAENADLYGEERIYIKPDAEDGKITLMSVKRELKKSEYPRYRGVIEIGKKDGGYTVVNEVMMEEYLYGVVPGEMPDNYGVESLKVQAVAARSYAYTQFFINRYHRYGANVDDSVNCQVYNNIDEGENSTAAVNLTKGQCITYNGDVINANYFSTSAGVTANSGDVWANGVTKQFPAETKEYLMSKEQYIGADYGDLSVSENMSRFIKSSNIQSYDSHSPWFRWNVIMTDAELSASINHNLKAVYEKSPRQVKTMVGENIYRSRQIETIGALKDLEITKRGAGGVVMEIKITGDKATVVVRTESSIRTLIRPAQYIENEEDIILNRIDGTALKNLQSLPSGFFIAEKSFDDKGNLKSVQFFGGGYGHGVGMSQNGVLGMVSDGHSYDEIIKHYYNSTEIENRTADKVAGLSF